MQNMLKFLGCAALVAFAGSASAQYALDGRFGSQNNGGGSWTVYCDAATANCGVVGAQQADGTYFFKASDGSEWYIVFSSEPSNQEEAQQQLNSGVEATLREEE